jgi:UDP-N-acetylglucosamine 2-epimerase (non-hydrolysing)
MKKILICVGTRPNFIKVTQFKKLALRFNLDIRLLHTGQHFDHQMSQVFFDELKLDKPDIYLDAQGNTQIEMMADIMCKFEKELLNLNPDFVLVPGDVNSSLACAIVASRNGFKVGHIESGLRSFDREMPEEINRILIDDLSDLFFITEQSGIDHLIHEGKENEKLHFVGNTMIDSLVAFGDHIDKSSILINLNIEDHYGLLTFHRPSNVDNIDSIKELVKTIEKISAELTFVFPMHPRTEKNLTKFGLMERIKSISNLIITSSLGYLDFMKLVKNAKLVITDSGGIQEETTFLQVPCLTIRENTERPVTINEGTNQLISLNNKLISVALKNILKNPKESIIPFNWDGNATHRILEIISKTN